MAIYYVTQAAVLVLLIGIAWLMPALVRPTLPFGVRIPSERAGEPAIAAAVRDYRRLLLLGGVALLAIILALTVALGQPFLPTLGIFAALLLCWSAYYRAHRQLVARKADEGWYAGLRQGVAVDTSLRSAPPAFPYAWGIPALVIAAVTLALGIWRYPALPETLALHFRADGTPDRFGAKSLWNAFGLVVVQWIVTALLLVLAVASARFRADLDIEALDQSIARHRRLIAAIQRSLLLLASGIALTFLGASTVVWGLTPATGPILALTTAVPIAMIIGTIVLIARGAAMQPATAHSGDGYVNRDDDAAWRGGIVYVNHDDPALFVPKRFGIGWTINFAHPAAWAFIAVLVLLIIFSALLGTRS